MTFLPVNDQNSKSLFAEAQKYIPGGVNSPVRAFKSVGGTPLFIKKGEGAYVTDEDGNRFIDYCGSWGPLISGHAHPEIIKKIKEVVDNGTSFGTPNAHEVKIARMMVEKIPHLEMVRFVNSGTEAVMSALRAARGFTGRNKIIKFEGCYHGHVDSMLVSAGSGLVTLGIASTPGVPKKYAEETIVMPLDNEELLGNYLKENHDDVACIIIEPIPANNGLLLQRKAYLQYLRDVCTQYGIVLLFDEVISGFRISFGGAAGYYGITPDLVTYGKIIGGGFPVGAYGGKKEIMSVIAPVGKVYQAGTLAGNPVAMAAGFAQLNLLTKSDFYDELSNKAQLLGDGFEFLKSKHNLPISNYRIGSILWTYFGLTENMRSSDKIKHETMDYYKQFHRGMLERGIYLAPSGYEVTFVSSVHTEKEINLTLEAAEDCFKTIYNK